MFRIKTDLESRISRLILRKVMEESKDIDPKNLPTLSNGATTNTNREKETTSELEFIKI